MKTDSFISEDYHLSVFNSRVIQTSGFYCAPITYDSKKSDSIGALTFRLEEHLW